MRKKIFVVYSRQCSSFNCEITAKSDIGAFIVCNALILFFFVFFFESKIHIIQQKATATGAQNGQTYSNQKTLELIRFF